MKKSSEEATVVELESISVATPEAEETSISETTSTSMLRTYVLSLNGITVHLSNIGASITKILVPSYSNSAKPGEVDDVVLGFRSPDPMLESGNPLYFCAVVGRVANRIASGRFTLPGTQHVYELETNNGPNHLHGGYHGFCHKVWESRIVNDSGGSGVQFTLVSADGDQRYPGTVKVTATYSLGMPAAGSGATLRLAMKAELLDDKATPINLANHSCFNLASHNSPSRIMDHKLTLPSDFYTPIDSNAIPTRSVCSLDNDSCMDFRKGRLMKEALIQFGTEKAGLTREEAERNIGLSGISPEIAMFPNSGENSGAPYGFDHNYVIKRDKPGLSVAGTIEHESTMRRLTVSSDASGVQVYSANFIDGVSLDQTLCKDSSLYRQWQGICLETQHFPDSVGVDEELFPEFARGKCFILRPGGPNYEHNVEYCFEAMSPSSAMTEREQDKVEVAYNEQGTDSDGNVYNSIEEMWESQGVVQTEGKQNRAWYGKAEEYYEENCPATVDGVLGGFASISDVDLEGSTRFLSHLRHRRPTLDWSSGAACECGAGIGRVSKGLLLPLGVPRCDLVESSSRLLSAAPAYIGDTGADRCRYYCTGLQDWDPPSDTYNIIWIQWVLCYLTDTDVVKLLKRCCEALRSGGVICLKENTSEDDNFVLDNEDASVTRSLPYLLKLIDSAGLQVVMQEMQTDLPDELFPVPMLALAKS